MVEHARRGRPGRARPDHHGEAVRHRPGERGRAQRRAARDLRREPDLPHRPLPRQGGGAEHPRASGSPTVCSSRSGTASTSTTSRSTCPRRSSIGHRGRLLRDDRRVPRHGRRPTCSRCSRSWRWSRRPRSSPRRSAKRRTRCSARCCRSSRRTSCAGQYDGYRDEPGVAPALGDRDVHRAAMRDRQLALGRRAVLPAHRQADGRRRAHHLDRVPRAAEEHVPARLRRRRARARPPHVRPRRRVAAVAVVLRQAARDRA